MTVAFDIDDTITLHPAFFALISQALVKAGHRVIIITFRDDRDATAADLRGWGVNYHKLICWTMETCDLSDADGWKSQVCRQQGVDIFFEDDPDVLAKIDPTTVCFTPFGAVSKAEKWKLRQQEL